MKRLVLAAAVVANTLFLTLLVSYVWVGRSNMTLFKFGVMLFLFYVAAHTLKRIKLFLTCFIYFGRLDKEDVTYVESKATGSLLNVYTVLILTLQSFGSFSSWIYFWLLLLAPFILLATWLLLQHWLVPAAVELSWLVVQFLLHGRYRSFNGLVMPLYSAHSLPLSMSFRGERLTPLFHRINAYDSLYEYIMRSVDAVFSGKSMHLVADRRKNGIFVAAVKWWRIKIPVVVVLMHLNPDVDIEVHARVYVLWGMFNVASKIRTEFTERLSKSSDDFRDEIKVRITWLI